MQDNTKKHHFTVVIPTRERCDTLEHSLRTCVMQEYDKLEIIVSDNFSQDRTREVVESYHDPRIRYINTGKRVSMTDNFEFALSHVKPEGYVIYIGDDDGLLPNAIRDINAVVNKTGTEVLRWESATFQWPDMSYCGDASCLSIPSLKSRVIARDSTTVIKNVLSFKEPFTALPMIYMRAAIDYKIIRRIIEFSGKFYHSITPDVYSGFAIAASVNSFVDSKKTYGLVGTSKYSNGISFSGYSSSTNEMDKFLSESNLPFHSSLVLSRSLSLIVAECFLQARDHLPFFKKNIKLNMQELLFKMMQDTFLKHEDFYIDVRNAVLKLGQMHNIPDLAQRAIALNPMKLPGSSRTLSFRNIARAGSLVTRQLINDLRKKTIWVDCSSLDVNNIYAASLLCHHILGLHDMNILGLSAITSSSLLNIKRRIIGFPSIGEFNTGS